MIENGYIALHRPVFNHPIVGAGRPAKPANPRRGAYSRMEAWLWLCSAAAHAPYKNGVQLERGQLVVSVPKLAEEWNWTAPAVRKFLDRLGSDGALKRVRRKANAGSIVTICNYDEYQPGGARRGQTEGQSTPENGSEHIEKKKEKKVRNKNRDAYASHVGSDPSEPPLPCIPPADQQNGVDPSRDSALDLLTAYNVVAGEIGWPEARGLNPKRRSSILARAKEAPWERVLENLRKSTFLTGPKFKNKSLSFLLQPARYIDLADRPWLDYDDKPSAPVAPRPLARTFDSRSDEQMAEAREADLQAKEEAWGIKLPRQQ